MCVPWTHRLPVGFTRRGVLLIVPTGTYVAQRSDGTMREGWLLLELPTWFRLPLGRVWPLHLIEPMSSRVRRRRRGTEL